MNERPVGDQANEAKLLRQLGARILSEANDLKRTPEALAKELEVEPDFVRSIVAGEQDAKTVRDFIWKMVEAYPISMTDLWMDIDDTVDGALIMRASASENSSRIFDRADHKGDLSPYYEYRDTAMSGLAPFKPEWIKELRFVDNAEPNNPDVAFNKGHLMHQMTFFIGAVNFYWEVDGEKFCAEMNTGDSCFITPFVPHSFTGRDKDDPALIIAVTFAGEVRRAISEIVRMGSDGVEDMAGDLRDKSAYANRLSSSLNAETLSEEDLEQHLISTGIPEGRARELVAKKARPSPTELVEIAHFLNLRPSDLDVPLLPSQGEVTACYAKETPTRAYPRGENNCYQIRELARTPLQPYLKGFDIQVSAGGEAGFQHGLHEYVYNYGNEKIEILWGEGEKHRDILEPGDSAYFQPMTPHRFECASGQGSLVCVRIPGRMNNTVLNEYASFPKAIRKRVAEETTRWF
jgi:uncharacterized RmlC-like cupin family protein